MEVNRHFIGKTGSTGKVSSPHWLGPSTSTFPLGLYGLTITSQPGSHFPVELLGLTVQKVPDVKEEPSSKFPLTKRLVAIEKRRAATYKRHLEMIFEHIEEHNQSLSKKIKDIVDNVKEMESNEIQSHNRQFSILQLSTALLIDFFYLSNSSETSITLALLVQQQPCLQKHIYNFSSQVSFVEL